MTVRIDGSLEGIDWTRAKADLAADDFDNGRGPRAPRMSFEQYQFIRKAGNCRLWPAGSKARGPGGEREPGSPDHPAGRGLRRMIAVPTGLWVSRRRERSRDYNPAHRARRPPSSGPDSRD
jgi:hypothetical protein